MLTEKERQRERERESVREREAERMRDETGDRVRGGACREQTTAAILHVNGISKGI